MLSRTVEYALRAVVALASAPSQRLRIEDVATTTQVPRAYLAKIMQSLVRAGLLQSQRGLGGGLQLSRPPDRMSVLDVVQAVDPLTRIESCPLNLHEHRGRLCPLHRRLDEATALVEHAFRQTLIVDLIPRGVGLCDTPDKPPSRRPRAKRR